MQRVKRLLVIGTEGHHGHAVMKGIHAYCRLHGQWDYHLGADNSPETVKKARAALRQWKADGIIGYFRAHRVRRMVMSSDLPAVNVSGVRELSVPSVLCDDAAVGRVVARHFLDSGFRNFAFSARTVEVYSQKRCDGFCGELSEAGLDCNVFTERHDGSTEIDWGRNHQRADQWLLSLVKPVAIMCAHDSRGQEIVGACRRLGLRVPDDVAIVGVDNDEILCQMCTPPLSSVDTDMPRIGYEAARLVDHLIRGGQAPSKPILVPPRGVVTRQSSSILAIDDAEIAAAVRFIRDRACESISVLDLLREIPISRSTMDRRFIRIIGRTPKAEIMRVRKNRAVRLLRETDLSISVVARDSGFVSPAKFSVFFRRELRMTPTQYRRECRLGEDSLSSP